LPARPPARPPLQVAAFKALVAQNRGCDVSSLKLICGGKVLRDEDSLDKSGVKDKSGGGFIVVMITAPKVSARRRRRQRAHARLARARARVSPTPRT